MRFSIRRAESTLAPMTALATLLCSSWAHAQTAPTSAGEATLQEVVVTGSRIARPVNEETLPTQALDQAFIDSRGFYSVTDALVQQPLFSSLGLTDSDFNQSRVDIGFSFIDLFGLGSERTLTLINGKRAVSSSSPQPNRNAGAPGLQVDINLIPTALIDRIETITVGGAPVYGADAIAGTVNVILKDRFVGAEADAQGGITSEGDAVNYRARGVYGMDFMGDRGNAVFAVEYSKRNGLLQTDRPGANDIQVSNTLLATNPVQFFTTVPQPPLNTFQRNTAYPGVSAYGTPAAPAIAGAFGTGAVLGTQPLGFAQNATGQVLMFNAAGDLVPVPIGAGNGTFVFTQDQPDFPGLYRNQDTVSLLNESDRVTAGVLGSFKVTDDVRFTWRANYARLTANNNVTAPTIVGSPAQPGITVSIASPFLSPTARATLQSATTNVGVALPFLFQGNNFTIARTLTDLGTTRPTEGTTDTYSAVLGLDGKLGQSWKWDVTFSYGKNKTDNVAPGVRAAAFTLASDAVMVDAAGAIITNAASFAAPSTFTFNAAQGGYVSAASGQKIVCRARATGAAGGSDCLPYNPIGGLNPSEVVAYLATDSTITTDIKQQFLQANVGGPVAQLPAGALAASFGAEWRRENSAYSVDALTGSNGLLGSAAVSPVSGKFTSKELYAETVVPLISDKLFSTPFAKLFQFEGAVRYIDNDVAGSDTVWTAGARWEIGESLVLRGNRTRSVRAPAIAQLFSGSVPTNAGVADPCAVSQITRGPAPATRRANCQAAVIAAGLAANTAAATTFLQTFTGAIGGVPGTIGGNPDLENERAKSWSAGLVFRPTFVPNFTMSVDWNAIRLDGAIQGVGGSALVAACYDAATFPNVASCPNLSRSTSTFNLSGYRAGFVNIGYIDFQALTAELRYAHRVGPGTLSLGATYLRLKRFDVSTDGTNVTDQVGVIGYEKSRAFATVGYAVGPFSANWDLSYTPGAWLDASQRDGRSNTFQFAKTDAYRVHTLSLGFDFLERYRLRLIADNLTNAEQPAQFVQFASVQSRIGRTYALGLNAKF